jgi:hypothetical protein
MRVPLMQGFPTMMPGSTEMRGCWAKGMFNLRRER